MNPTGPIGQHGQVKEGDRILKVGNVSLKGLENMEAASVLRNSSNPVKLILNRRKRQPGEYIRTYILLICVCVR